jgi:RNA polymerase sigma-70 factor (ECF subfamily)
MQLPPQFSDEEELILGCLSGNRQAQRQLYDTYSRRFMAVCLRYLKDQEQAEDVMIQSFMKIFEKLSQFQGKGSFEGWMKRIVVTQALMAIRSNRSISLFVSLEDVEKIQEPAAEDLNQLEVAELMDLVQSLPLGYRTVFNLFAIEGYSHQEIGELLGITESTSKSQLNRARSVLKEKITIQQVIVMMVRRYLKIMSVGMNTLGIFSQN